MRLTWRQRLAVRLGGALERIAPWHRLPRALGLLCLIGIRIRLRFHNLYDPAPHRGPAARPRAGGLPVRAQPAALGRAGARAARPQPRLVSERLLARNGDFAAVPFLNLLAAAWLQFQVHDWIVHPRDPAPAAKMRVPLPPGDGWPEASNNDMLVARTAPSALAATPGGPPVYDNTDSHWWDASQVYGSTPSGRPRCANTPAAVSCWATTAACRSTRAPAST